MIDSQTREIIEIEDAEGESTDVPHLSVPDPYELQQQLAALKDTLEANTAAWAAERNALMASVEAQKRARASAESDVDFFRAQYLQASGFVTSVRAENEELTQQVAIAEERAKEGVRLVRATFAERVRQLEAEVAKFRAAAQLLVERERRAGVAEILQRAGEEPELRARCAELERRVEELEFEKEALEMDWQEDLEYEQAELAKDMVEREKNKDDWMNEVDIGEQVRVEAKEESPEVVAETDVTECRSVQQMETAEADGEEMVHRCQWRTDGSGPCTWLFSSVEVCVYVRFHWVCY
jgi:hypothetical protein